MNNEAEFVIAGLRMASILRIIGLEVRSDSVLVSCQVNGEYATKDEWMEAYLQLVLSLKLGQATPLQLQANFEVRE